jgi:arylsulfatase A-like enzyme
MDLTATFLAAAGVDAEAGTAASPLSPRGRGAGGEGAERNLDGINLLPIIAGTQPLADRTFCWRVNRSNRQMKAIRHGDWKFVQDAAVEMLFNIRDDIGERRDLAFRHPEILADLKQRLKDWEAEMDASPTTFVVR